jgi:hypothetical protein
VIREKLFVLSYFLPVINRYVYLFIIEGGELICRRTLFSIHRGNLRPSTISTLVYLREKRHLGLYYAAYQIFNKKFYSLLKIAS